MNHPPPKWYVDQSRHLLGYACPMARYLRYHHDGHGYASPAPPEIRIGSAVHENVERAYMWVQQSGSVPDMQQTETKIVQSTVSGFEDTVTALSHAYTRLVLPWIVDQYDLVAVEPEISLELPEDIVWMVRPDVVVKSKQSGLHSIVEFKTTGARPEKMASLYRASLQTLMNAEGVRRTYGECEAVQVHIMQRGSDAYPTPLTHAYYRLGNPPLVTEDWQPKSRRPDGSWLGKLYRKVRVSEHRALAGWIWSMPLEVLSDYVPMIANPLDQEIHALKVSQAIASIVQTEREWKARIAMVRDLHTGQFIADFVPRTFNCVQYERICEFDSVCFNPTNWTGPIQMPEDFSARKPHHEQEILQTILNRKEP